MHNAKTLRKSMTKQERHLWYDFFKKHKYHWYRQRPMGNYILDFYCGTAKLAVELDGSQHYEAEGLEYDEKRTKFLNENGIKVIRFINPDIDRNFEAVCMEIERVVAERVEQG